MAVCIGLLAGCGGGGGTTSSSSSGTPASISFSVSSIDFGSVTVGVAKPVTISMTNNGSSSVDITKITVSAPEFSLSGVNLPLTLNSGQKVNETITFTPTKTGPVSANFSVTTSAGAAGTLPITATGLAGTAHSVDVSWVGSSTTGVVSYNVYRSTITGGPYTLVGNSIGTQFTDSAVKAGSTYFYVVTSVDSANLESLPSAETKASIPTP